MLLKDLHWVTVNNIFKVIADTVYEISVRQFKELSLLQHCISK